MKKPPAHLRDVSVARTSLEKALTKANNEGLTVAETAELLAQSGMGWQHLYPVRFFRDDPNSDKINYVVGDLVVERHRVAHLHNDVHTHNVSNLYRVTDFYQEYGWYGGKTYDAVRVVNVRTGRTKSGDHQTTYLRAEINE